ncbi:hypothetical protein [Stieleria varia]|uniref:Uncharacterized protein n=1 Tax=Stieleria varia TaxID=2528005 RepID=A0A5C5ZJM4_9BACT|nr:hypothetical protein [Stieleria varia]TWT87021.1 hypothetical protein Pla52n_70320 [Stieleria varia]
MRLHQAQEIIKNPHSHPISDVTKAVAITTSPWRRFIASIPLPSQSLLFGLMGFVLPGAWSLISREIAHVSLSTLDRLWCEEVGFIIFALTGLLFIILWSRFSKQRWLITFSVLTLASTAAVVWIEKRRNDEQSQLVDLLSGENWMAYDPVGFNPLSGSFPTKDSIREDFKAMKKLGVTGVITFGMENTLGEIPYIASEFGFKVIAGLSVPDDFRFKPEAEFVKAIEANEAGVVDAFCVGHIRGELIEFDTLAQWMTQLRNATGKPVTFSAPIAAYSGQRSKRAREIGDWYFPDVGGAWQLSNDPSEVVKQTRDNCFRAVELSEDKPVLCKMIGYPSGPASMGFSPQKQREFFLNFWRSTSLPFHVFPSYAFAFDRRFVTHAASIFPDQRHPAGAYLGLIDDSRQRLQKAVANDFRRHWGLLSASLVVPAADYSIVRTVDADTGNVEHRLHVSQGDDKFHFGSVVRTPAGAMNFRPHPSDDPDGWGASIYMTPFFGQLGADACGVDDVDLTIRDQVIHITSTGSTVVGNDTRGHWELQCELGYDTSARHVIGTGSLQWKPELTEGFVGDLSVLRISTNVLCDVELDSGGMGDTGDSTGMSWSYLKDGLRINQSFLPTMKNNATFPQDQSTAIEIFIHGNLNRAAGDGPRSKRTPDIRLLLESDRADLAIGAQYDTERNSFEQDNFGVTPLIRVDSSKEMADRHFYFSFESQNSL